VDSLWTTTQTGPQNPTHPHPAASHQDPHVPAPRSGPAPTGPLRSGTRSGPRPRQDPVRSGGRRGPRPKQDPVRSGTQGGPRPHPDQRRNATGLALPNPSPGRTPILSARHGSFRLSRHLSRLDKRKEPWRHSRDRGSTEPPHTNPQPRTTQNGPRDTPKQASPARENPPIHTLALGYDNSRNRRSEQYAPAETGPKLYQSPRNPTKAQPALAGA
jgi:hypothetical protein